MNDFKTFLHSYYSYFCYLYCDLIGDKLIRKYSLYSIWPTNSFNYFQKLCASVLCILSTVFLIYLLWILWCWLLEKPMHKYLLKGVWHVVSWKLTASVNHVNSFHSKENAELHSFMSDFLADAYRKLYKFKLGCYSIYSTLKTFLAILIKSWKKQNFIIIFYLPLKLVFFSLAEKYFLVQCQVLRGLLPF